MRPHMIIFLLSLAVCLGSVVVFWYALEHPEVDGNVILGAAFAFLVGGLGTLSIMGGSRNKWK